MPQTCAVFQPPAGLSPAVLSAVGYERVWDAPAGSTLRLHTWALCRSDGVGLRLRGAGDWRVLDRPAAYLIRPGTYEEDYRALLGRPCTGIYFIFRAPEGLLDRLVGDAGIACIADPRAAVRTAMQGAFAAGVPDLWRCQAALAVAIGLLLQARPAEDGFLVLPEPPPPEAPSLAQQVDAYLGDHLGRRICLDGIARHLGLGSSTLSHRYRAEAGCTPMARLTRLRIERARTLLLRGERLAEVARACGFCDQFHFSRVFARTTGQSPSAFLTAAAG